ncbi:hypothetical protein EYF80_046322 [Liparis tanakae]|uniref:Uncharacterized protein n=1 Tax=Liparis tanakae TaxID=230148 RepID=A0A4Z2FRL5_9TELE|nr:hypothetical protein EYF80_046322 [Liparis tanakae]
MPMSLMTGAGCYVAVIHQPIFPSPSASPSSMKPLVSDAVSCLAPLEKFCRNSLMKHRGGSTDTLNGFQPTNRLG